MLAALASGQADASVSLAPGRITHMASGPAGELAVLVSTARGASTAWSLVVLDERGIERMRIAVDDEIVDRAGTDLHRAFVGLTGQRLLIAVAGHGLFGWNRASGLRVG